MRRAGHRLLEALTRLLKIFARRYRAFVRAPTVTRLPTPSARRASVCSIRHAPPLSELAVRVSLPDGSTVEGIAEDLDAQGRITHSPQRWNPRADWAILSIFAPSTSNYGDFQQAH